MAYGDYPNLAGVKKILVIKLRALGDTLLCTPVFSAIKAHLPNTAVHAYVYRESAPLLEGHPAIDQILTYDKDWKKLPFYKRIFEEIKLLLEIRRQGYDLVINLTEGDRGALAARFANALFRVGFTPKGKWQKKLYTHTVKSCPTLRHQVERNLDALRRIGIFPSSQEKELELQVDAPCPIKEPFILIHPTSRWKFKCWPVEKMRSFTEALIAKRKKVVFTCGTDPDEIAMLSSITRGLNVVNLAGKVSLKEFIALVDKTECLVCVDSLPFHVASALKRPVVALFGPTSEVTWGPWRNPRAKIIAQNFSCRPCYQDGCGGSKRSECLTSLDVPLVLSAIDESLRRNSYKLHETVH